MVKSMLAGISGLKTHQSRMDVIGNNIANVNTWGYKSMTANFKDSLYTTSSSAANGDASYGGSNPSQLGYGVGVGSITMNFSVSSPSPTGRPLDAMCTGSGFFIVGPKLGVDVMPGDTATPPAVTLANSGLYLSRVGIFSVDSEGYLTDDQRNVIYGYASVEQADGSFTLDKTKLVPLKIPLDPSTATPGPATPYELENYQISKDGSILGKVNGGKTVTVGKLALASVENVNALEKVSGYYYNIGENTGRVSAREAGGDVIGDIMGGYLEMPNVELAKEFADMITCQRGFQANSKIITVTDEMLQELVNIKR